MNAQGQATGQKNQQATAQLAQQRDQALQRANENRLLDGYLSTLRQK